MWRLWNIADTNMYHPPYKIWCKSNFVVELLSARFCVRCKKKCKFSSRSHVIAKSMFRLKKHVRNEILGMIKGCLSISPDKKSIYLYIIKLVNRTRFKTLLPAISPSISAIRHETPPHFNNWCLHISSPFPPKFWHGTGIWLMDSFKARNTLRRLNTCGWL